MEGATCLPIHPPQLRATATEDVSLGEGRLKPHKMFRSRTRANGAAGANERVCGEMPDSDAHPNGKSGFTEFMQERILGRLYLGVNDYASFTLLIGDEGIDVKIHDFRVI